MDVVKDETGEAAGPGMGASAGRWEDEIGTMLLGAGVRPAEACAALARSLGTSGERAGVLVIFRDPETLRFGAASWPEGAAAPDSRTLRRFVTSIGGRAAGDPLTESWARPGLPKETRSTTCVGSET